MRCVNLDWLEVYVLENAQRYPCNADYFRERGYYVKEREFGTRVWREMFVIEDEEGEPFLEIRRNPFSGEADINGLVPESCHIRLANRTCYYSDAVERLRQFMLSHDYIYKRIFRLDICYDFRLFDYGDKPSRFAQRYIERKYRKINQCKISSVGDDNWTSFDWECLSWGSRHSMVSTKMYNKTKELASATRDKPYIRRVWFDSGLVADPIGGFCVESDGSRVPAEIWRIEFSLKSGIEGYFIYEDVTRKKKKKQHMEHTLDLYDTKDKLWRRFEELAYHYFHFKHYEEGKRKDRCKDKLLFRFNTDREFLQIGKLPRQSKPDILDIRLENALRRYRECHFDKDVRNACDVLLKSVSRTEVRRLVTENTAMDISVMQKAIALKINGDRRDTAVIMMEIRHLLEQDRIF